MATKELLLKLFKDMNAKINTEYTRRLTSAQEVAKNQTFNKEINTNLRLAVTRTWGDRTLKTDSYEWKKLRNEVIKRDQNACRFCGIRISKYLVCDHINGDASDNRLENLGLNCPLCDLIRHCGRSGVLKQLSLYRSNMEQVDIVKNSFRFFLQYNQVPKASDIDPEAMLINISTVDFANELLKKNYSELPMVKQKEYKGFFRHESRQHFKNIQQNLIY